jgi:hypothetical protein
MTYSSILLSLIYQITMCQPNFKRVDDAIFNKCLEARDDYSRNVNLSSLFSENSNNYTSQVVIFINKNNSQFIDGKLETEVTNFINDVVSQCNQTEFIFITYTKNQTIPYYCFGKSINDNPIFIQYRKLSRPIELMNYSSEFKVLNNAAPKRTIIHFELNREKCTNKNFIEPFHNSIKEICTHIQEYTIENDFEDEMNDLKSYVQSLQGKMEANNQAQQTNNNQQFQSIKSKIEYVEKLLSDKSTDKKNKIVFSSDFVSDFNNFSSIKMKGYYPMKESKNSSFITTSLGTHLYNYSLFMDGAQYTWNDKNFSIQNLQESGTVQFQSAGIGIGKNWCFSKGSETSGWGLQALIGGNFNFIKNATYQWTNGSANIRGYINGISDEIINVPDLGFQDGVTLSGMNGNADLKKRFPSMEGEIKLLYQFQNISFAGGVGYTYSAKLASNHPENPIFSGQQSNSLTTSMMPLRISTSYCSLSTIIHF